MDSIRTEIQTVFGEEFRRATHRIWYRVMTLMLPAVLLVLLIVVPLVRGPTSGDEQVPIDAGRIGVVDLSGELLANAVSEADIRVFPDRQAGLDALLADEITSFFIISQDYLRAGRVEWLHTGSSISAELSTEGDTR